MFYILRVFDPPFASTPPDLLIVAQTEKAEDLPRLLQQHRGTIVAESIWHVGVGIPLVKATPPELARAVDAWNSMCDRVAAKIPRVRKAEQYIAPYRRWKREVSGRTFLLEDVVAAAEKAQWTHGWVNFGWLLGKKDGTFNCEKVLNDQTKNRDRGRRAAGNGHGQDFSPEER